MADEAANGGDIDVRHFVTTCGDAIVAADEGALHGKVIRMIMVTVKTWQDVAADESVSHFRVATLTMSIASCLLAMNNWCNDYACSSCLSVAGDSCSTISSCCEIVCVFPLTTSTCCDGVVLLLAPYKGANLVTVTAPRRKEITSPVGGDFYDSRLYIIFIGCGKEVTSSVDGDLSSIINMVSVTHSGG